MTEVAEAIPQPQQAMPGRTSPAAAATLILIALGDYLAFGRAPGLNLFVFAVAGAGAIVANRIGQLPVRAAIAALALSAVTALPLLEAPSLLAAAIAIAGLTVLALFSAGLLPARLTAVPPALFRFGLVAPLPVIADIGTAVGRGIGLRLAQGLLVWIVPAALALVFVALFWSANPVVADVFGKFDPSVLAGVLDPVRIAFWLVIALTTWTLLRPRLKQWNARPATSVTAAAPSPENLLFGRAAILRSLLVFNALFGIETALDLTYLWGGASLPDGMSHAEYAHRGAYPLIVTALLAAAFVLAAMRRNGPANESRPIRVLVYAWIAQNILLCVSSILRLKLYVEAYSLTEWRIAAGIWMALVAAGLALILLRILLRRSNEWLVAMNLATLALTLYACALIDLSALIANFNVDHAGEGTDIGYLRQLGPSAIPALDRYIAALTPERSGGSNDDDPRQVRQELAAGFAARSRDWRSWSFRDWRLSQYLASHPIVASGAATDNHWPDY